MRNYGFSRQADRELAAWTFALWVFGPPLSLFIGIVVLLIGSFFL